MLNYTLRTRLIMTLTVIFSLSAFSLFAQPADFMMECLGDGRNSQPIQATIQINGENAVPDEDFVALFDSDGFVVGMGTVVVSSGFCSEETITLVNFGVFGVPPNDDAQCPLGFGANDDEVLTGLVYDGSENIYYNLPGDLTYAAGGLNMQPAGALCTPLDANFIVLPATLTAFRGVPAGPKHVRLNWEVAREENVSHYEVQRSTNGRDWTPIGEIAAAGNSETTLEYDFNDLDPTETTHFYRLRMVDLDEAEEYSGIVIVELEPFGDRTVRVFPNPSPTTGQVSVQLAGAWDDDVPVTAQLTDAHGRRLADFSRLGSGSTALSVPAGTQPGLYVLRVTQADRTFTQKVIFR